MSYKTLLALIPLIASGPLCAGGLTHQERLGKAIFFDEGLSLNANQSCASCHAPEAGWTGPDPAINAAGSVYEGSVAGRFGNRKPPSAAYASPSPVLHVLVEDGERLFVGGSFWDGRATGETLGSPTAEQAQGPFLNPLEQALGGAKEVIDAICDSDYRRRFLQVCGWTACKTSKPAIVQASYDCVGYAVAAYEASPEVNQYSSKYDAYLAGMANLTRMEKQGLRLFKGKAKCASCHVLDEGPNGEPPLFTDFTYDNLGVPANPENPFYASNTEWIDLGLGGFLKSVNAAEDDVADNLGKVKVPTLRNLDKWDPALGDAVKAYGHNGYFKSLWQIVHFYNTRDVKPACQGDPIPVEEALAQGCWPSPEVLENVNRDELGNLRLSRRQEQAIVAFLKTLSDGYEP